VSGQQAAEAGKRAGSRQQPSRRCRRDTLVEIGSQSQSLLPPAAGSAAAPALYPWAYCSLESTSEVAHR